MKLALDLGYSGARMALPMSKVLLAEELGFDSVWTSEAAAAFPNEDIDEGGLIGPPARIREKFRRWADAGLTSLRFHNPNEEAIRTIAEVARAEGALAV